MARTLENGEPTFDLEKREFLVKLAQNITELPVILGSDLAVIEERGVPFPRIFYRTNNLGEPLSTGVIVGLEGRENREGGLYSLNYSLVFEFQNQHGSNHVLNLPCTLIRRKADGSNTNEVRANSPKDVTKIRSIKHQQVISSDESNPYGLLFSRDGEECAILHIDPYTASCLGEEIVIRKQNVESERMKGTIYSGGTPDEIEEKIERLQVEIKALTRNNRGPKTKLRQRIMRKDVRDLKKERRRERRNSQY